jgi:glycosyltransferase involved in cell wall biosynthesis
MKVTIACPTYTKPFPQLLAAVEASVPALDRAGIEHSMVWEIGCPYISHARATMLRKALDANADAIVFLDHDMSFEPDALVRLIETKGDVVSGAYRFKTDEEKYMGALRLGPDKKPIIREDGCIRADWIPAGFLKITANAVHSYMLAYPELMYGPKFRPSIDLFNHGAHEGVWWGEDYAFSRRWNACGGEIWVIPDLNLTHHSADKDYLGNFHEFLCRKPGGSKEGQ